MGNKQNQINNANSFRAHDWVEQPQSKKAKAEYGNYKTFRQIYTNQKINQHEIVFHGQEEYHSYLDSFYWRNKQDNIVKTIYLKERHESDLCSTTYMADVYIQEIPIRLSDVTDIPYPQNLYVLEAALDGYQKIFNTLRYFPVDQNQVCVDVDGYVRVWCNADLSKNYASNGKTKEFYDQTMMVNEIITMISENTDHDLQPCPFLKYLAKRNKTHPTFQQAKTLLHDYSIEFNTPIPRCFESILDMFSQKDDQEQKSQKENQKFPARFMHTEQPKISNSVVDKVTEHFNRELEQLNQSKIVNNNFNAKQNSQEHINIQYLPRHQSIQANNNYFPVSAFIPVNFQKPKELNSYHSQAGFKTNFISQGSEYRRQGQPCSEAFTFKGPDRQGNFSIERPRAFSHQQKFQFRNNMGKFANAIINKNVSTKLNIPKPLPRMPSGYLNTNMVINPQQTGNNGLVRSKSVNKINFSYTGRTNLDANRNQNNRQVQVQIHNHAHAQIQSPKITLQTLPQIRKPDEQKTDLRRIQEQGQNFNIPTTQRESNIAQNTKTNQQGSIQTIARNQLNVTKNKLQSNQDQSNHQQFKSNVSENRKGYQYCYYTSTTEEQIDPQIIADLLKYEEAGTV